MIDRAFEGADLPREFTASEFWPELCALSRALAASELVFRSFVQSQVEARKKADDELVSVVDHAAHEVIEQSLSASLPHVPIVSEEGTEVACGAGAFLSVDPLDGTSQYLSGSDHYVSQIGLVVDGVARLGGILHPPSGRRWIGLVGVGVLCADLGSPYRVMARARSAGPLRIILGSRPRRQEFDHFRAGLPVHEVLYRGSAGAKAAAVVEGEADLWPGLFSSLKEWDLAAPAALVVAAGGAVHDLGGHSLAFGGGRGAMHRGALVIGREVPEAVRERILAAGAEVLRSRADRSSKGD